MPTIPSVFVQYATVAQWYLPAGRQGAEMLRNEEKVMKYFVYVIKSNKDGRLYVGLSKNPQVRLKDHNFGRVFSTKGFRPWEIVYTEEVNTRDEAREREKYLKSGIGKEFLKSIIMPR